MLTLDEIRFIKRYYRTFESIERIHNPTIYFSGQTGSNTISPGILGDTLRLWYTCARLVGIFDIPTRNQTLEWLDGSVSRE